MVAIKVDTIGRWAAGTWTRTLRMKCTLQRCQQQVPHPDYITRGHHFLSSRIGSCFRDEFNETQHCPQLRQQTGALTTSLSRVSTSDNRLGVGPTAVRCR
jgi:hypothetical protein